MLPQTVVIPEEIKNVRLEKNTICKLEFVNLQNLVARTKILFFILGAP